MPPDGILLRFTGFEISFYKHTPTFTIPAPANGLGPEELEGPVPDSN